MGLSCYQGHQRARLAVVYDAGGVAGFAQQYVVQHYAAALTWLSALSEFNASFQAYNSLQFGGQSVLGEIAGAGLPQWLKIDLGSPMAASSYSMQSRTDTVAAQATAWTLEGSSETTAS